MLQASYRLAQVEAAAGSKDAAFAQLARATGAGMISGQLHPDPDTDPLFASLKTDARYKDS